jgi:hypothetical protein
MAPGHCVDPKQLLHLLTAGAAHKTEVIAWAVATIEDAASSKQRRQLHSTPLFSLPIFLTAPRQFPIADGAAVHFQLRLSSCRPGMGVCVSQSSQFTLYLVHALLLDNRTLL